jgi:hypothetical protein
MKRIFRGTSVAVLLLLVNTANAGLVRVDFSGTFSFHSGLGLAPALETMFPVGDRFYGSYTYESTAPGTPISGTDGFSYTQALTDFSFSYGGLYATMDNGYINLENNNVDPDPFEEVDPITDSLEVMAEADVPSRPTNVSTNITLPNYVSGPTNSGWHVDFMYLRHTRANEGLLDSSSLTDPMNDFAGLGGPVFYLNFQLDCCTGNVDLAGRVDSMVVSSVVPVPASGWLFSSALAGLGWMRRKQAV